MACARRGIAGGRAPADRNIVTELASNLAAGGVGETLRLGERGGGQHDAELVATQACDQRRPEGRGDVAEDIRHAAQQRIPGGVALPVVDLLQAIEVADQQRGMALALPQSAQALIESVVDWLVG